MQSSSCSLVIAVKPKAKEKFLMTAILLFHILQKISVTKVLNLRRFLTLHYFSTLNCHCHLASSLVCHFSITGCGRLKITELLRSPAL
jgi:hypothetical protein